MCCEGVLIRNTKGGILCGVASNPPVSRVDKVWGGNGGEGSLVGLATFEECSASSLQEAGMLVT